MPNAETRRRGRPVSGSACRRRPITSTALMAVMINAATMPVSVIVAGIEQHRQAFSQPNHHHQRPADSAAIARVAAALLMGGSTRRRRTAAHCQGPRRSRRNRRWPPGCQQRHGVVRQLRIPIQAGVDQQGDDAMSPPTTSLAPRPGTMAQPAGRHAVAVRRSTADPACSAMVAWRRQQPAPLRRLGRRRSPGHRPALPGASRGSSGIRSRTARQE